MFNTSQNFVLKGTKTKGRKESVCFHNKPGAVLLGQGSLHAPTSLVACFAGWQWKRHQLITPQLRKRIRAFSLRKRRDASGSLADPTFCSHTPVLLGGEKPTRIPATSQNLFRQRQAGFSCSPRAVSGGAVNPAPERHLANTEMV